MELAQWTTATIRQIRQELRGDEHWSRALASRPTRTFAVHLAIFVEPFLTYVLDGKKSIESRFSTRQCAPFRRVSVGDVILLKAASGPVKGICEVSKAWYFDLDAVPLAKLRERFAERICATDDDFWQAREKADYATLLRLRSVREVSPLTCPKRDRRGWVVLDGEQLALPIS